MKDEITYSEKYKKPGLKHIKPIVIDSEKMKCIESFCLEAGHVIHNGKKMEYQIIKAYFVDKE